VWGPGDKNVVPRVLALTRAGKLKIIGSGENKVDVTHITNVVDAHLLAEGALVQPNHPAGGRAYFITNGEPVLLWKWINNLLMELNEPPITKHVSLSTAYFAGGVLEATWRTLRLKGEPLMTRFVAKEMATDHWFDITAARRDLGYHPLMSVADGVKDLVAHYRAGNAF
jgi:2-alkyl-3-oxoalkanoate reductase